MIVERMRIEAPSGGILRMPPTVESKRRAFVLWKVAAKLERLMRIREEKAKS